MHTIRHNQVALFLTLVGVCVSGCGGNQTVTVPVSGKITFAGGPCPADGTIVFSPIAVEDGRPRRPGVAEFTKDGSFRVTSFKEGDGLIPGRYQPSVSCWIGEPRNEDPSSFERLNYVPRNFKAAEVIVTRGGRPIVVTLDVPKKSS